MELIDSDSEENQAPPRSLLSKQLSSVPKNPSSAKNDNRQAQEEQQEVRDLIVYLASACNFSYKAPGSYNNTRKAIALAYFPLNGPNQKSWQFVESTATENRAIIAGAYNLLQMVKPELPLTVITANEYLYATMANNKIPMWEKMGWDNRANSDLWQKLQSALDARTGQIQWGLISNKTEDNEGFMGRAIEIASDLAGVKK